MDLTHYEVLGVDRDADREALKAAYRRRARETHPDSGGDDAEFAAVALAWWTLSSPDRRARYDAGQVDDEDDWGEDLGWDAAPPPRPGTVPTPRPAPPSPRPQPEPRPGRAIGAGGPATGEPADDPAGDPADHPAGDRATGPVDPLTSAPRVLPARPPAAGLASPWHPSRRRSTLLGVAAVLVPVVALFSVPALVAGSVSSTAWAGVIAFAGAMFWAIWLRSRAHLADRVTRFVAAAAVWGSVVLFLFMGGGYLLQPGVAPARVVVVALPLVTGLALAVDSGRRLRHTRARARLEHHSRRQRGLARRWNRVLALQVAHGAAHVEAGDRNGRSAWLLVADRSGQVLDWAPAHAPVAWARLMRTAGLDVLPVPQPGARHEAGRAV